MKLFKKNFKKNIKKKACEKCKLKDTCGDLPGLCMHVPYTLIISVIIMLTYFLFIMDL